MPIAPAASNRRIGIAGRGVAQPAPAASPRIIVPSVGMKLRVRYPPPLATYGFTRRKQIEEPDVERVAKVVVLIPVRREAR